MKRAFLIILILSLVPALFAGTTRRVRFPGMRAFSTSELEVFLGISRGDSLDLDALPEHLRALEDSLVAADYLFARVDSVQLDTLKRGRLSLSVYTNLGPLARVEEVQWQGDSLLISPKVARDARIHRGAVFRWASLRLDIGAILDDMNNHGWPFARVTVLDIVPRAHDNPEVDVLLRIQKGPQAKISFLRFEGNKLTKPQVLQRETRLRLDEVYSESRALRSRRYLQKLPFLRAVHAPEIVFDETGRTGLAYTVVEAPSTHIDLVAGYLPEREEGEKGMLTGLVDINLLNLFGTGRRALIHWDQPDRSIQTIQLEYEEPWVARLPIALALGFRQRIEDTVFVKRELSMRATASVTETVDLWGRALFEEVIPDSVSRMVLGLPATTTRGLEVGFVWDTRDWPLNPRSGAMFSTFGGVGWRRTSGVSSLDKVNHYRQNSAGLDAEVALEVFPRWVADIACHGRMLESDEPEILLPDLYRLGGARSLRGYREEQFLGSRIGWVNSELRYWLGPRSRFFGFVDGGAFFRERWEGESFRRIQGFKVGVGVGLRVGTPMGIWGFDYALGEGDRLLSGKVHLSLRGEF